MELETHASNASSSSSSPYAYMSSNGYSRSSSVAFYCSAPASPGRASHADQLFPKGHLKLPPRLQGDTDFNSFSQSQTLSPNPSTRVCQIPFAPKSAWNDDFDPFTVALQKVREEKRGRSSHHRRVRSYYSPFNIMFKCSSGNGYCNQDSHRGNSPTKQMQVTKQSYSSPLEFKGSSYARWVRNQNKQGGLGGRGNIFHWRGILFRQRVRLVKTKQDKPTSADKCKNVNQESKVQKLKAVLLRCAWFGRESNGYKQTKKTSGDQKLI